MAEVWLAHDQELDREVAIKFHTAADDRARFEREARAIAALAHENIAAVYDYGETERGQYLVLEYLPGGSLAERLRGGQPLPDKATWTIARQLAAALAHAHRRGIVHRDLKPSNVLFDVEGRAKLADFGIARAAGQSTLTDPGSILGTAAYLSPEVAAGEPAGRASDVYSFGVLLFQLLTGKPPFEGETVVELALKHRTEPAPRVENYRSDAPVALARVAGAALAKDPAERPPDGLALLAHLDEGDVWAAPEHDETATLVQRPLVPSRSRRRFLALLAVLVVLALAGAGVAVLVAGSDAPTKTKVRAPAARTLKSPTSATGAGEEVATERAASSEHVPTTPTSVAATSGAQPSTAVTTVAQTTEATSTSTGTTSPAESTTSEQTEP